MSITYYETKESVDQYIAMAKDANEEVLAAFDKVLKPGVQILELGSGSGADWARLNRTYHVIGSDNSEEFLRRLRKKYPKGTFLKLEAPSLITDIQPFALYANKVLHHLEDATLKQTITRMHQILQSRGVVCLSFWQGEGSEMYDDMLVNNHTEDELKTLFAQHFEILSLTPYQEFEPDDSLLLIAQKR